MATGSKVTTDFALERWDISGPDKAILLAIIRRRDEDGWAKLRFSEMAELAGLSESACKRRVTKLAGKPSKKTKGQAEHRTGGLLEVYSDHGGRANGNRYRINMENVPLRPKKRRRKNGQYEYEDAGVREALRIRKAMQRQDEPPVA